MQLLKILFILFQESYNPQTEAISPTLPDEAPDTSNKAPKDEIINSIHRVDREISKVDTQVTKLQKKKVSYT